MKLLPLRSHASVQSFIFIDLIFIYLYLCSSVFMCSFSSDEYGNCGDLAVSSCYKDWVKTSCVKSCGLCVGKLKREKDLTTLVFQTFAPYTPTLLQKI